MKKGIVIILLIVVLGMLSFVFLFPKKERMIDALKFKDEYESLNGKTSDNDKKYRKLNIPDDNPFIYKEALDIVNMIDNKETFVVYFGFSACPWCRSVLPTLIEVADDLDIDTIYYVNVQDIRDVLELDGDNNVITAKKGTDDYYKLLKSLDNVLEDYVLGSADDSVETGEKRIYAPNIVAVVGGDVKGLESGISSLQNDSYMELTDEIINDTYNKFEELLSLISDGKKMCTAQSGC